MSVTLTRESSSRPPGEDCVICFEPLTTKMGYFGHPQEIDLEKGYPFFPPSGETYQQFVCWDCRKKAEVINNAKTISGSYICPVCRAKLICAFPSTERLVPDDLSLRREDRLTLLKAAGVVSLTIGAAATIAVTISILGVI